MKYRDNDNVNIRKINKWLNIGLIFTAGMVVGTWITVALYYAGIERIS